MAILDLRTLPDPILKKTSKEVTAVDTELQKFMDDMLETMYSDDGIGLAAVQVGVLKQVVVIDIRPDNPENENTEASEAKSSQESSEKTSDGSETADAQDSKPDSTGDSSSYTQEQQDSEEISGAETNLETMPEDYDPIKEYEKYCPLYLVNPKITWYSQEKEEMEEGCLSVPGETVIVERPTAITLEYLDYNGNEIKWDIKGMLARVVQHELDHTKGVTLLDYLSKLKKDRALKKLKKQKSKAA